MKYLRCIFPKLRQSANSQIQQQVLIEGNDKNVIVEVDAEVVADAEYDPQRTAAIAVNDGDIVASEEGAKQVTTNR